MPTDTTQAKTAFGAHIAPAVTAPTATAARLFRRAIVCPKTGTENAATNVAEVVFYTNTTVGTQKLANAVYQHSGTNAAVDNSNFVTISIIKRLSNGTGNVTAASATTQGNATGGQALTAHVAAPFTLGNATVTTLAAGDSLGVQFIKSGTGVGVPVGTLTVLVEDT